MKSHKLLKWDCYFHKLSESLPFYVRKLRPGKTKQLSHAGLLTYWQSLNIIKSLDS